MADLLSTTGVMPHIPFEVQIRIANELESVECGRNVSLVCKNLRFAGETRVWRAVDLTSGWDIDGDQPLSVNTLRYRSAIVDSKLKYVLAGIEAHPVRGEAIRLVRVEPSDGLDEKRAKSLLDFLALVAPQITHLSILPLTLSSDIIAKDNSELDCHRFSSFLGSDNITFPNVSHVQYARGTKMLGPLPDWIFRINSLYNLEFSIDEVSLTTPVPVAHGSTLPKTLDHIESFTINRATAGIGLNTRVLRGLFSIAPNFRSVEFSCERHLVGGNVKAPPHKYRYKRHTKMLIIRMNEAFGDSDGDYEESDSDRAEPHGDPSVIAGNFIGSENHQGSGGAVGGEETEPEDGNSGHLTEAAEAEVTDVKGEAGATACGSEGSDSESDCGRPEFRGWDEFLPEKDPFTTDHGFGPGVSPMTLMDDAVMEVDLDEDECTFNIEKITLPKDQTLTGITILTIPRLSQLDVSSIHIDATPSKTGPLTSNFIRQLRRTPDLSKITVPYTDKAFPADYAPFDLRTGRHVGAYMMMKDGHPGATISHYARGSSTEEVGFELWHVRMLELCAVDGKRHWRDLTRFRGKTVPRDILEGAYKKAGLDVNDPRQGRCMTFGKGYKAWYYLYNWRESAGERDDEDDRLSDASFE